MLKLIGVIRGETRTQLVSFFPWKSSEHRNGFFIEGKAWFFIGVQTILHQKILPSGATNIHEGPKNSQGIKPGKSYREQKVKRFGHWRRPDPAIEASGKGQDNGYQD